VRETLRKVNESLLRIDAVERSQHAPATDYSSELTAETDLGCDCGEQGCHACDADEFYAEMRVRLADRSPA